MATIKKTKVKKEEIVDDLNFDEETQPTIEQDEDYVFIQVDPKTLSQQKEETKTVEELTEEPKQAEQPIQLTDEQIKKNIQERILSYKKRNNIDKRKI